MFAPWATTSASPVERTKITGAEKVVLLPAMAGVAMTASQALAAETYRRTYGIVSNLPSSDPAKEADVIMTAVILGFSADYYDKYKTAVRFDIDPVDAAVDAEKSAHIYAIGALNKAGKETKDPARKK